MKRLARLDLLALLVPTFGLAACSSAGGAGGAGANASTGTATEAVSWDCSEDGVPGGSAVHCTSSDPRAVASAQAAQANLGAYDCPASGPACAQCPSPSTPVTPPVDSGVWLPPPANDAGIGTGDDDGGSSEDGGSKGNGKGNGNGNDGSGSGTCGCTDDAGAPAVDAAPPVAPPPYHCDVEGGDDAGAPLVAYCQAPPTCAEGTHASACGACVPDDTADDCTPPSAGGCWVTGGGYLDLGGVHANFGGNAMPMKSGVVRGEWEYDDHGSSSTGNTLQPTLHGQPSYLYCRHVDEPGPGADNGPKHDFTVNQAFFGGPARLQSGSGPAGDYWFDVVVKDHGEGKGAKAGGPDTLSITVRALNGTQAGPVLYQAEGELAGGNIQIHPPNNGHPAAASTLPTWVSLTP